MLASFELPRRIGLTASRRHHETPHAPLPRLLRAVRPVLERLGSPELVIVGRAYDALMDYGVLDGYARLTKFPYGREGGLMKMVSRVVDPDPAVSIDTAVYLIDPVDPSSAFPEAVALKRQCVVHGKPFLSTAFGVHEWLELIAAQVDPSGLTAGLGFDLGQEAIALIAHDSMKDRMVAMAEEHYALLDRFAVRYATGTTGGRLNDMAMRLHPARKSPWVTALRSGPLGGDAQIAELILDRRCRRVLFLEDPHVARQHEADIQLLERAARVVTDFASCMSDPNSADRWLTGLARRVRQLGT